MFYKFVTMVLSSVLKTLMYLRRRWQTVVLVITPLLLLPLVTTIATPESRCAFVVILMATYWATEPMPLPITALFPVVLLPLLGLASSEDACAPYLKSMSLLYSLKFVENCHIESVPVVL